MRSISGKTGSQEDIKRFLVKYTHTHTHNCTHRLPCLGQRGAQALIMSGTHERVAPHEKTNFTGGAVVRRLTSEPLSGHIVPRWMPSDSLSLNSTVSVNQSGPSAGSPPGKTPPTEGTFGVKPCLYGSGKMFWAYYRIAIRLMTLCNK